MKKNNVIQVLEILKKNKNKFISGEKISTQLGISRVSVHKIVHNLISEGYKIFCSKTRGYKFISSSLISPEELLNTKISVIKKIYYYRKVSSTMDIAKEIVIKNPNEDKILILAEQQTHGRGRIQRKWFSPKGGLYFSLILKPQVSPQEIFFINYIFSSCVTETIRKDFSIQVTTKWPNDVVFKDKKICGILVETDTEIDKVNWVIVGVGVNLNIPQKFFTQHKLNATSVLSITKQKVDITKFLISLFQTVEKYYELFEQKKFDMIIQKWYSFSSTIGQKVKILTQNNIIKGKAINVSPQTGALIVETPSGTKEVLCGDCIHLR